MKNVRTEGNDVGNVAEWKYFLIWTGLWIVALLVLLPR